MVSKVAFILIPLAIFLIALAVVILWDRNEKKSQSVHVAETREGSFRSIYHSLWLLILWFGTICYLPLLLSFKKQIAISGGIDRFLVLIRVLAFPALLFVLLTYSAQKGYLKWLGGLNWPDKENSK